LKKKARDERFTDQETVYIWNRANVGNYGKYYKKISSSSGNTDKKVDDVEDIYIQQQLTKDRHCDDKAVVRLYRSS